MPVLIFLSWFLPALLALFLLVTVIPIRYALKARWQGKAQEELKVRGELKNGIGPFEILLTLTGEKENYFCLRLVGVTLKKSLLTGREEEKQGKKGKDGKEAKKGQDFSLRDLFTFLDRAFIRALLRIAKEVLRHSSPRVFEIKGVWGFSDPYYTGLLAAARSVLPGIEVEPDFTGEVRDLTVFTEGRIRPAVIIYYGLKFAVSPEARPVLKKLWQNSKNRKNKNKRNRVEISGV